MRKIDLVRLSLAMKQKRKEKDMTQVQLGKLTGINKQVICRIELGKTVPSISELHKLLNVLEIDFNSILEDEHVEDVFMFIKSQAIADEERKGIETMISMMLCLNKHEQLRRIYNR